MSVFITNSTTSRRIVQFIDYCKQLFYTERISRSAKTLLDCTICSVHESLARGRVYRGGQ